jgi:hypothetical protein
MEALHGVTIVCWLGGTVEIPEGRLRMFFEKLVDTPVRGVVYEGPFEELARTSSETWQIALQVVTPAQDAKGAVDRLLGG